MDLGNFTGLSIYGLVAAVVYAMCNVAQKFFAADSVKVRVFIFVLLFLGLAVPITVVAMRAEVGNAPVPPVPSSPASAPAKPTSAASVGASLTPRATSWSIVGIAYAQPAERWIFCGTSNATTGTLANSVVATSSDTEYSLVNQTRRLTQAATVYDRAPTFSFASFRWSLGNQSGSLAADSQVEIASTKVVGQRRVWCRLRG